jgi:hypothetical protein
MSDHYFPGKMLSNLAPIMAHEIAGVYDQLVLANSLFAVMARKWS